MKLTRVYRMENMNKRCGPPKWVQSGAKYYMAWKPRDERARWVIPYTMYLMDLQALDKTG